LVEKKLERELVSEIHRSIIKTVNAQSLLSWLRLLYRVTISLSP
jgi:hypothetical protein